MNRRPFTIRDQLIILVLAFALIGAIYYLAFYKPIRQEMTELTARGVELDAQVEETAARLSRMTIMEEELNTLFASDNRISEIPGGDNSQAVMAQLDALLGGCTDYNLTFADVRTDEQTGLVRRDVMLEFTCRDYATAREIAVDLSDSQWRCLVSSFSVASSGDTRDLLDGPVKGKASVTFYERRETQ